MSTAQILGDLKSLPQGVGLLDSHYYDTHGNANQRLQTLMIRRFEATQDLCRELDSVSFESHPAYVASLYRALGTVKDPASIPWLERALKGPKRREICDYWLSKWRPDLRGGAWPMELRWVAGTNEWSEFFRTWANSETNETSRLSVLRVMQGWLHDPATQAFFESLERNGEATDEEVLLAQVYLRQHGSPFNEAKLRATTIKLRKSPNGTKLLLRYAAALRSKAFVAGLIDVADQKMEEEFMTPQRALEAITFQRDIAGSSSWKNWHAAHGREERRVWMDGAASQLTSMATTNIAAAKAVLSKAIYTWNDPAMLPHMERLIAFKQLRSEIVGWINLTYHEVPFLRSRLLPLALKIRQEGEDDLENWARNLMRGWDFLEQDKTTWEQYVRRINARV